MEQNLFQGLDIDREKAKRYGRFKALRKNDLEDVDEEYTAKKVTETIVNELDSRIEDKLQEKGHLPKDKEFSPEKFREIHERIENIENEWEAAFKGKEYSEVSTSDIEVLEGLLSKFLRCIRHEIKTTEYIEHFHSELAELNIDSRAVETILGLEESEGSEVGKHLENLNKRQRQDLNQVRDRTNINLQRRQEEFKSQIEEFENQVEIYRNHLETLEAVEKELEEIEKAIDREEIQETALKAQETAQECMDAALDLIEVKRNVLDEHTKARKIKKGVNKLFLSGFN